MNKQEFYNTLKYGKLYTKIFNKLNEFKEFVVKQENGTATIDYNDITKLFTITTYLPYWKTEKFNQPDAYI